MSQTSKPHAPNSISEQLGMKTTSALCMSVRMVAGLREKKKGLEVVYSKRAAIKYQGGQRGFPPIFSGSGVRV